MGILKFWLSENSPGTEAIVDTLHQSSIKPLLSPAETTQSRQDLSRSIEADAKLKSKYLGIAKEADENAFFSADEQFAPFIGTAEGRNFSRLTERLLQSKTPTFVKSFAPVAALLTISPTADGVSRNILLYGLVVEGIQQLDNDGGVNTIRYNADILEQRRTFQGRNLTLEGLQQQISDSTSVRLLSAQVEPAINDLIRSWISWPDVYIWKAVAELIEVFNDKTVASDTVSLLNQIGNISPGNLNVENSNTIQVQAQADQALQKLNNSINLTFQQDSRASPAAAFRSGISAVLASLWEIHDPVTQDRGPSRSIASFILLRAAVSGAEQLNLVT